MDKFLEKYNLPKLNEEEEESLNRPITASEIEAVIKKLLVYKSPGPEGFTGEFQKTFREELPLSFSNYSENFKKNRRLPNLFQASIFLIPKPGKDTTEKTTGRYC